MEYWVLIHSNGSRLPTLQMWAVDLDSEWYSVVVTFQNHHFLDIFWKKKNPPRSGKTRALKTSGSGSLSAAQVNYQRFCQSSSLFVDQRSCLPPIYKLVTLFLSKFHKLSTELRHLLVGNWLVLRRNRTADTQLFGS